jgi:hypothetical protein
MLPVCVSEDVEAAKALLRRRLVHYALLPNYRAYWKEAGYVDEMSAVEQAIARQPPRRHPEIPHRLLARRQHPVRPGRNGPRGRRGMARRRRQHAGPRAQFGCRQPDHGAQGAVRRIQLIATRMCGCSSAIALG